MDSSTQNAHANVRQVQERVRGQEYDEVVDELIEALRERYGARLVLHWEDFNVRNSFRLLDKYVAQVRISIAQSMQPGCWRSMWSQVYVSITQPVQLG